MLIKEYRIPLPMTVEEYRIAQLYMIAKKSREESKVRVPIQSSLFAMLTGLGLVSGHRLWRRNFGQ
jgi:hypothetical protein